eukprot:s1678_g18.t1
MKSSFLLLSPGVGRYQVGPEVSKPQLEMAIVPETPLPPQPYIVVYTQSALMEQSLDVGAMVLSMNHQASDNFASVANITFPDFDLDAGDLGGEVSWDAPQETNFRSRLSGTSEFTSPEMLKVTAGNVLMHENDKKFKCINEVVGENMDYRVLDPD